MYTLVSFHIYLWRGFSDGLVVKNPPANAEVSGSIPGSGRFPGEGNSNPLQYSCLGNPKDWEDWLSTAHGGHKETDNNWQTKQQHLWSYHQIKIISISIAQEDSLFPLLISCSYCPPSFPRICSVQFSRSVMSNSLRPHEPQHTRPPYPSPTARVHPNQWP